MGSLGSLARLAIVVDLPSLARSPTLGSSGSLARSMVLVVYSQMARFRFMGD
mgnify:CR=1 FL=1